MRLLLLLFAFLASPLTAAPVTPAMVATPPAPIAARSALVLEVATAGLQQVLGSELALAGLDLATLDPSRLWLHRAGQAVPLEVDDGGDGRFDPADTLRFYAPPPGDRWNQLDRYWLTVESQPGPRMAQRNVAPAAAPLRETAIERGLLYQPVRYDSRRPGPDGDRWFAAELRPTTSITANHTLTLTTNLPPTPGTITLTVTGQLVAGGPVALEVSLAHASTTLQWAELSLHQSRVSLDSQANELRLAARVLSGAAVVLLDRVTWERPVRLDLAGRGAFFSGVAGHWRYQFSNPPAEVRLYDLSEPSQPVRLISQPSNQTFFSFEDGPLARDYLVAGPGTLHQPTIRGWAGMDLATPRQADVVYIVPAALRPALEPLLAHRMRQGHAVTAIEVEAIYAGWSHGQVAPEAIRAFLRYAVATWPQGLRAAVLVGDGSVDPHDWTQRGPNNRNLIPPYLAPIDPWLGETACEGCYARLTEADPTSQILPDLAVGRLPVKNGPELTVLVNKLIAYDATPANEPRRARLTLLAEEPDTAGDFALAAEAAAELQPSGVRVQRIYYDPSGARGPASAVAANNQLRAAFADGTAVLVYHGHSHSWQWARTEQDPERGSLFDLYEPDQLPNHERLAVVLTMTCLSSAFQTPAISGTTIDERLVLAPGGAVAVWGPTGFGVAHGHQHLQRGFFDALWQTYGGHAELGTLTMAGYAAVVAGGGPRDVILSYALLGDPLTKLRINAPQQLYLPLVAR
ncbi:MAG: C25 family cysteine peptidase [Oscillochloridaceae bacterium umkhey_bin13]